MGPAVEAGQFERTNALRRMRVFPEDIAPRASRAPMVPELDRADVLPGALAMWSLWRGYLENEA